MPDPIGCRKSYSLTPLRAKRGGEDLQPGALPGRDLCMKSYGLRAEGPQYAQTAISASKGPTSVCREGFGRLTRQIRKQTRPKRHFPMRIEQLTTEESVSLTFTFGAILLAIVLF